MKKNITETAQASFSVKKNHPTKALPATSAQIRIPTQRPVPQLKQHIKRSTQQVTKEWTAEVSHTDQLSSQLPPRGSAAELAPKRIQRFHQKKTTSLLKKMAELHESAGKKVDRKVVAQSSDRKKQENDQDELWRDMIKPHVERHFQIDRITNFFT